MSGFKLDLEQLLMGMNQEDLLNAAAQLPGETDKNAHRIGSMLLAQRLGSIPAGALGLGREVVSGTKQAVAGEPFFGRTGFDPEDMRANLQGIAQASPFAQGLAQLLNR